MPIKLPETDDTGLNMTPMIDIVFNLVIFFMLSVDLSQKDYAALNLPRARNGVEDKDPSAGGTKERRPEDTRFIVNLKADGNIVFKKKEWGLNSKDPAVQDKALENLRVELIKLCRKPELREADGASKVSILIRGDRQAKWRYVQWIMQVCADPQIKIYKLQFAVEAPPR